MHLSIRALLATSVVAAVSSFASAITVDGSVEGAYGAAVKTYTNQYLNGSDATGGVNTVSTYFTYDDNYVYAAAILESGASAFPGGANIYVYSSTANTLHGSGTPGVYGDANDIIAEGTNGWTFALNSPPWAVGIQPYAAGTVNFALGTTGGKSSVEISIARSLLGNYSSYRFGGQFFAYEFHRGTNDREAGALVAVADVTAIPVAVPLPTTAMSSGALLALTALRRRR